MSGDIYVWQDLRKDWWIDCPDHGMTRAFVVLRDEATVLRCSRVVDRHAQFDWRYCKVEAMLPQWVEV